MKTQIFKSLIAIFSFQLFVALAIAAVVAEPEAEATAAATPDAAADAWYGYYGHPY